MDRPRLFLPEDYEQLVEWMKKRGNPLIPYDFFSQSGVIVPEIAVGFLYLTNSKCAYLDGYYSNPDASRIQRKKALYDLTQALLELAAFHKVRWVKAETEIESIKKLADTCGFKRITESTLFLKEI